MAVQQGLLTEAQLAECLRERERLQSSTGHPDPRPLYAVAVEKGFVSKERLEELFGELRRAGVAATLRMIEVDLECAGCSSIHTVSLDKALRGSACTHCSSRLSVPDPRKSRTRTRTIPVPPDVQRAMEDPKNRMAKYVLVSRVGKGGMGEVWRAWDTVLHRTVAVKIPKSVGDEEIRRLYTEAQGTARLSHPNIASVFEVAKADDRHYIAMQFITGVTAEQRIEAMGGKRDVREIVRWVRDAARAAHYAHTQGVIHRDIKPQNIMVDDEGRVVVMDFGLAKILTAEGDATVSGVVMGTPSFMPPEQAAGMVQDVDPRSDVYSLGATLYYMLSGRKPYEGTGITDILMKILTGDAPTLRQVAPHLPWELEAVVEKAMRRKQQDRYATAEELADDLARFLEGGTITAKRTTITYRFAKKLGRHRAEAITAGVSAAALLVLVGILVFRGEPPPPPELQRIEKWRALLAEIKKPLSADRFGAEAARPLLERARKEFADRQADVDEFISNEHRVVAQFVDGLPREKWLESRPRVERYLAWLEFMDKPADRAREILAYRGTFSLTIHVHPHAELRGEILQGLPPDERHTPLRLAGIDVPPDGAAVELIHPRHGTKRIPLTGLADGKSYTIEGSLEKPGEIQLREVE